MIFVFLVALTLCMTFLNIVIANNVFGSSKYVFSPSVVGITYCLLRVYPGTVDASILNETYLPLIAVVVAFFAIFLANLTIGSLPRKDVIINTSYFISLNKTFIYWMIFLGIISVLFTFAMLGKIPLFYAIKGFFSGGSDLTMHEARRMNTVEHHDGNASPRDH